MTPKLIHHRIHGHSTHDLSIFLAERMIVQSGHELLSGEWFSKKHLYNGEPDIFARVKERWSNGAKKIHAYQDYVIEIESDLTKANREKKINQFMASNSGVELIIINLAELKGEHDSVSELEAFIRKRLVFVEG